MEIWTFLGTRLILEKNEDEVRGKGLGGGERKERGSEVWWTGGGEGVASLHI